MDNALIVIDIQNDYFPGGGFALEGSILQDAGITNLYLTGMMT